MNGFNRSYMYRSTETEKKGRKLRNHREDACKCFPPFVRFHYHDCPALLKPCPIHGNLFYHAEKHQKVDREQNVIISFHPSTKTERLLQPIKTLLAHCNSETKINFQYYSPENGNGKESVKPQNGQNAYESLKKSLNNSIFVEKTKSFVANKTNKVKKLKQCFQSPCNSIAQKTRSQTSIKEKLNQILREEAKQSRDAFYNLVPEIPPDDQKFDPKWFNSNKGSFLSDERSDSDFITVTQQDKTNTIHHKIFEIKHRKGVNDISFVGFPQQQTHLVYSTVNMTGGGAVKEKKDKPCECNDEKRFSVDQTVPEEAEETGKPLDPCPSEKTNRSITSSSSGSVYITPFIFVPKGMEDSDTEMKSKVRQVDVMEIGLQVEGLTPRETQLSVTSKKSTASKPSRKVQDEAETTKCQSVLLQTDSFLFEQRICHSSRRLYDPQSTSRVEQIYVDSHERAVMTRNYDEESSRQSKRSEISRRTIDSTPQTKAAEMQTCSGGIIVRTPDSGRCVKTAEIQTCSGGVCARTPDSGRCAKTAEIQTGSGTPRTRTPDSARYTRTVEMQTCSCSTFVRTPDSGRYTKTNEVQTWDGTPQARTPDSTRYTRTHGVQHTPRTEVLIQARWDTRDKTSQTEDLWNLQVSVKTFDSGMSKSHGSEEYTATTHLQLLNKEIQTSFSENSSAESEFIQLSSPEVTYVIKPFEQQESDQAMDKLAKTWWGKSHSDSDLCEKLKCACSKLDGDNAYLQSDFDKNLTPEKSTITKVYESGAVSTRMENCPTVGNVTVRTKETVERFSDSKQTCTREEELSAAVSDLSELKKIIQEFFEKGNLNSRRNCECGGTVTKEPKVDAGTMTDSFILPPKEEHKKTFVDKTAQTISSAGNMGMKEAGTQVAEVEKHDSEAQTSVPMEEAEQEQRPDSQKIKLRSTVIIDKANQSKTFFICSVCGRDVKNFADATTNTSSYPERPKLVSAGTECKESFEVKMITKKVQSNDNSKAAKATSPITEEKAGRKTRLQDDICRPESSHRTKIPVPSHNAFVHFKNNETVVQRATNIPAPELPQHRSTTSRGSNKGFATCEKVCICDEVARPSTSRRPSESTASKEKPTRSDRKECVEVQTSRRINERERHKSKKNDHEYYPVLVTHFWPEEIFKTWKSIESAINDIPSNDDAKSQTTQQKRNCSKDLTAAAAGKKMKVDASSRSQEFVPELSDLYKQIRSCNIVSYPAKTQDEEKNSTDTDEEAVKKLAQSLCETSLEIDEDFLQESLHFSDSSNTENNFSSDEEDEGERTSETTEPGERQNFDASSTQTPKLKSQSHSAVTFNTSFPEDTTTSKSQNKFLIIINPKKHKMFRRKHSK